MSLAASAARRLSGARVNSETDPTRLSVDGEVSRQVQGLDNNNRRSAEERSHGTRKSGSILEGVSSPTRRDLMQCTSTFVEDRGSVDQRCDSTHTFGLEDNGLSSIPREAICIGDEIGKGRFREVYAGRYDEDDVVILRYPSSGGPCDSEDLRILGLLFKKAASEAFVALARGFCQEADAILVVQEKAAFGSLKAALDDPGCSSRLRPAHQLCGMVQLAHAMVFLQSQRIVHGDLASRNVLVFRLDADPGKLVLKLSDFGLGFVLRKDADSECRKQPHATRWSAPETVIYDQMSHRSDLWSLGVTFWELFSYGATPWHGWESRLEIAAHLHILVDGGGTVDAISSIFPQPSNCPLVVYAAVLSCLQVDEYARPASSCLFFHLIEQLGGLVAACQPTVTSPQPSPAPAAQAKEVEAPAVDTTPSAPRKVGLPLVVRAQEAVAAFRRAEVDLNRQYSARGGGGAGATEAKVQDVAAAGRRLKVETGDPDQRQRLTSNQASWQARGLPDIPSKFSVSLPDDIAVQQGLDPNETADTPSTVCSPMATPQVAAFPNVGVATLVAAPPRATSFAEPIAGMVTPIPGPSRCTTGDMHRDDAQQGRSELERVLSSSMALVRRRSSGGSVSEDQSEVPSEVAVDFKVITDFLWSAKAKEVLGTDTVKSMRREIGAAKSRESNLSVKAREQLATREIHYVQATEQLATRDIHHDQFIPLAMARGTSVESKGFWTLWSVIGDMLRRQDFASEAQARAAFDLCTTHPNVLRDPFGRRVDARSWMSCGLNVLPTPPHRSRSLTPPARDSHRIIRCRSAGPLICSAQLFPCMGQ